MNTISNDGHSHDEIATEAAEQLRLPADVQALLMAHSHSVRLGRGESLFLKGSEPNALFGVVQGRLRVSAAGRDGREAVISVLEPGHWFGEVSLLIGRERVYDTCAVEASEVAVVDADDFHRLVREWPDVHMAFTRLVCHRLRQALAWIDDVILQPLPARLAHRLLTLEARAAAPVAGERLVVSQEDLAAMLGVSRQSVNRQLKAWEREGLLSLRYGGIELHDRPRLLEQADGEAAGTAVSARASSA